MTQQPQPLADLHVLDLIQAEHDHQPATFRANGDMHAPRLLAIAQALRAELQQAQQQTADRIATEIRQYCPDHGDAGTCRMDCHCAIADEITRPAAVSGA